MIMSKIVLCPICNKLKFVSGMYYFKCCNLRFKINAYEIAKVVAKNINCKIYDRQYRIFATGE